MINFYKTNTQIIFIMVTMFLNFMGFSILFPILPFMVSKYIHTSSGIAFNVGLLISIYALCQFFATPGLGALSDRYGRKPILLISLFGSVVGYLILGFAGALWMLFLGRIIDGITGGNISTIYTYMADISKPQDRGKYFGLLGAAAGVGMIFGPLIGGLSGSISVSLPLFIAAGITILNMIFGFFILPESLSNEHRASHFDLLHLNPFHQFSHILNIPILKQLFLFGFIFFIAMNGMYAASSVFLKNVFLWNSAQIGFLLFIVGFVNIFSQGYLINKLLPKLGDIKVSIIGLILTAAGFFLAALTSIIPSIVLIYFAIVVLNIGDGLFEPSLSGLISKSVGPTMQGRVQGANQGMQSVARIIGPFVAAYLFRFANGLPYLSEGIFVLISFVILYFSITIITSHTADYQKS